MNAFRRLLNTVASFAEANGVPKPFFYGALIVGLCLLVFFSGRASAGSFGGSLGVNLNHDTAVPFTLEYRREDGWGGWLGAWRYEQAKLDQAFYDPGKRVSYKESTDRRTVGAAAVDYQRRLGRWTGALGLAYLEDLTPLNGTRLNFSLTVGYRPPWDSKRCDFVLRHLSHGSVLGIADDRANGGWNFVQRRCWL